MRKLLLFCLLFYAQIAKAQIYDDSLKHICRTLFEKQEGGRKVRGSSCRMSIDEIFSGYFLPARVYKASCDYSYTDDGMINMHGSHTNQLYVLNAITGGQVPMNDAQQFNVTFATQKQLSNLDRCYLYLFLVVKIKGTLTMQDMYRNALKKNSIYVRDRLPYDTGVTVGSTYRASEVDLLNKFRGQIDADITRSTRDNIYMYHFSEEGYYRYHFFFTSHGRIDKVEKALLK